MTGAQADTNVTLEIVMVIVKTILFFIFAIGLGLLVRFIFKKLAKKYDHHRRIPIFAIALALTEFPYISFTSSSDTVS